MFISPILVRIRYISRVLPNNEGCVSAIIRRLLSVPTPFSFPISFQTLSQLLTSHQTFAGSVGLRRLLIVSLASSSLSILMGITLLVPIIFEWRHTRNFHFIRILASGIAALFTFLGAFNVRFGISSVLYAVGTISLNVVEVKRGGILEVFLWAAFVIWLFAFVFAWLWEVSIRRGRISNAKAKRWALN